MSVLKSFLLVAALASTGILMTRAEEKAPLFDVVLLKFEDSKIQAIKAVREMSALGLADAKKLVESAPQTVREGVTKEEGAENIKALVEAKCQAELRPSKVETLERFEVVLKSSDPARKDQTLATIHNLTGVSEEALSKTLAAPPGSLKSGLTKVEAERIKYALGNIKAEVEIKECGK